MSLLEVRNLQVAYGSVQAVKGVDFHLEEGETVCLIGANGAGKTTILKAMAGLLPVQGGSVHYANQSLTRRPAFEIARLGLNLVPEGRGIFPRMTVRENLHMGAYTRRDHAAVARDFEEVLALLPRLAERKNQKAGLLSGGEQQMLAIGRAWMARPRLLMLDEPSMGLAPIMVETVFELIKTIAARGVSLFLVEQNAHLALKTAQRGYVMEQGIISMGDSAANLSANPAVKAAYLGEMEPLTSYRGIAK
jgi:branched-chain amino acid transport system ATP-binding protein